MRSELSGTARHTATPSRTGTLHVAHLLRKYNPSQWGGTETAVQRLCDGLTLHGVQSTVHCPRMEALPPTDPIAASGHGVKRFRACVPVWGISKDQRRQLVSVGGNLLSFDLIGSLWSAPDLALIHTHTHNRIGGIGLTVARLRGLPLVVTIHGGVLDLPPETRDYLLKPLQGGIEWGKIFGWIIRSRRVLQEADAILTCNQKEAALWRERLPGRRVIVQPHSVPLHRYTPDHRQTAQEAFPQMRGKRVILVVGRIDPVKNQGWLISQAPEILRKRPDTLLVLAGACTDAAYGKKIETLIRARGLEEKVLRTGGLPPGDPRLIGLMQSARVVVVPSLSETFGIVLLEAWASGRPVIASRTSGAMDLIRDGENGWLYSLGDAREFHEVLDAVFDSPFLLDSAAANGRALVESSYDVTSVGGKVRLLYEQLIEERHPLRDPSGR